MAAVVGCQDGEKLSYANVSGSVKYNGQPIEKGKITFALEGRPPSTIDIVDGKYAGSAMVGQNKVSVSALKKTGSKPKVKGGAASAKDAEAQLQGYMKWKAAPGEFGGPPKDYDPTMVEFIPPDWGSHSTQMRVVESGGANNFDIEIKGK
ncbi:MAG TPA: hypothetical protein VM533_09970 [Fimbriiglobus sp.]|nr:hypothetical protein [Fimbriiglobus sp.]